MSTSFPAIIRVCINIYSFIKNHTRNIKLIRLFKIHLISFSANENWIQNNGLATLSVIMAMIFVNYIENNHIIWIPTISSRTMSFTTTDMLRTLYVYLVVQQDKLLTSIYISLTSNFPHKLSTSWNPTKINYILI